MSNVVIMLPVPLEEAPRVLRALRDSAGVAAVLKEREKSATITRNANRFQNMLDAVCGRELAQDVADQETLDAALATDGGQVPA
jgi:hypothetical protein